MSTCPLNPLIHDPERLRIVATLAALHDGEALAVTRLQKMIRLPPDSLISGVCELGGAGYVQAERHADDPVPSTVALTYHGRAALDRYAIGLRRLVEVTRDDHQALAPGARIGDADRDAAAAALGEHFAQGRLTLNELNTRLGAALTATTRGELSQAARDLPDLAMPSATLSGPRRKPARSAHQRRPSPGSRDRG
jgi:hypothetical protein